MRRAPRLSPDERIAAHVTRVGRFRRIDPAKSRRLPSVWKQLARIGWGILMIESFRRARAQVQAEQAQTELDGPESARRELG